MPRSLPENLPAEPTDVRSDSLTEDVAVTALRRTGQPVALSTGLAAGTVIGYTLLGVELVLARFTDGRLLAADTACPHKGARLTAGCVHEGELVCPYHGWRRTRGSLRWTSRYTATGFRWTRRFEILNDTHVVMTYGDRGDELACCVELLGLRLTGTVGETPVITGGAVPSLGCPTCVGAGAGLMAALAAG